MPTTATPPDVSATRRRAPARRHLRIRSVVVIVVLVPTVAMAILAGGGAATSWDERRRATQVEAVVDELVALTEVRTAVTDEDLHSSVVALASDLGATVDDVSEFYGIDYARRIDTARETVDGHRSNPAWAGLEPAMAALDPLRARLDRHQATFAEVNETFRSVHEALDRDWLDRAAVLTGGDVTVSGEVVARSDALGRAFVALVSGGERTRAASEFHRGDASAGVVVDLVAAERRFADAVEGFPATLGPSGAAAWDRFVADSGVQAYEATLRDAARAALAGETSSLADDVIAFGESFADGERWVQGMTEVVRGTATDLRTEAAARSEAATTAFAVTVLVAGLLALMSLGGAAYLSVSVSRPVRRLGRAADEVRAGVFDGPPIELRGPRELVETAETFNDMTATLAAVEANVVALADDPGRAVPVAPLPGRVGEALEAAFVTLRGSVRAVEDQRRQLAQLAAHDGMTGLLNRVAALPAIERALAQTRRTAGAVMLLYVDLDGLKAINDTHGHTLGDAAIVEAADALRQAARASDVVARIGGDEFVVAGPADEPAGASAVAERFRAAIAERAVVTDAGERVPLRASVGLAVSDEGTSSVEDLIREADAAMYSAKRAGRDRIAVHERAPGPHAAGSTALQG